MKKAISITFDPINENITNNNLLLRSATVNIGRHTETVECEISSWNIEEYSKHWDLTYESLRRGKSPAIFCSSLDDESADLWVVSNDSNRYVTINLVAPRSELTIANSIINSKKIESMLNNILKENISKWIIPYNEIV